MAISLLFLVVAVTYLPFKGYNSPQLSKHRKHARNTGILVQCDECDKWCLLFSKRKLTARQKNELEGIIADVSYSCGATADDLILPDTLKS